MHDQQCPSLLGLHHHPFAWFRGRYDKVTQTGLDSETFGYHLQNCRLFGVGDDAFCSMEGPRHRSQERRGELKKMPRSFITERLRVIKSYRLSKSGLNRADRHDLASLLSTSTGVSAACIESQIYQRGRRR